LFGKLFNGAYMQTVRPTKWDAAALYVSEPTATPRPFRPVFGRIC
jgi:hypothetical protein